MNLLTKIHYPKEIPPMNKRAWQYVKLRESIVVELKQLIEGQPWGGSKILAFSSPVQDMIIKQLFVGKSETNAFFKDYQHNWRLGHDGQVVHYITKRNEI